MTGACANGGNCDKQTCQGNGHEDRAGASVRRPQLLVPGDASAPLLHTTTPLSFWGGVDPSTAQVVDVHHPLAGQSLSGHVLALPGGRGSCSGSLGVLECIYAGNLEGIILRDADEIIALGALVAGIVFGKHVPVAVVGADKFARLAEARSVSIHGRKSGRGVLNAAIGEGTLAIPLSAPDTADVALSRDDEAMLAGERGQGAKEALELVLAMARMYGARTLTPVTQAHIDACIYVGPASLRFAQHFAALESRFAVPTTLNAVSSARDWRALGVSPADAEPGEALAQAYLSMGADPDSLTCAPYLLPSAPAQGDQIVWAESNAVLYANSVLGARTIKYPDMLDVAVALTGRAPLAGCHLDEARRPTLRVRVDAKLLTAADDDVFWPLLGYHVGHLAGSAVVLVTGLEDATPSESALKAFGAGFGTTSASPMFHIAGITPEAADIDLSYVAEEREIRASDLRVSWDELNSASTQPVGLVALGNPHLAIDEFASLAELVRPRVVRGERSGVPLVLTAGRHVVALADDAGYLGPLRDFGATIVEDTCWCMIRAPVVPDAAESVITTSAKYAHYGPGGVGKPMYFTGMAACVDAAVTGEHAGRLPVWLE